jgi:hypothetical protein
MTTVGRHEFSSFKAGPEGPELEGWQVEIKRKAAQTKP